MIFIICLIVTIGFILLTKIFDDHCQTLLSLISGIIAFTSGAATVIMIVYLCLTYIDCPRVEAKWQEQYASLNTRVEEHMYYPWNRENLIKEVQEWNEDFAAQERSHNDFWVGIFNPESIDGLSKIDLIRIE